jgi:hypothetical protein
MAASRIVAVTAVSAIMTAWTTVPVIPLEMQCLAPDEGAGCALPAGNPTVEDVIRLLMYGDDPMVIKAVISVVAGPDKGPDLPPMIVASR